FKSHRYRYRSIGGGNSKGRAHSLWFCDAQTEGDYLWHETAFVMSESSLYTEELTDVSDAAHYQPFALSLTDRTVEQTFASNKEAWPQSLSYEVAWPFAPVIPGDLDEFINRWVTWFGDVANGRPPRQSFNPGRSREHSWRQPLPPPSESSRPAIAGS